jgi:hypothetical protein
LLLLLLLLSLLHAGTLAHTTRRRAAMRRFCATAQVEMDAAGLLKGEKSPSINKLLNRLLGMHVSVQEQIFAYFTTILDKVRGRFAVLCGL